MSADSSNHPNDQALRSYGLGKLDDASGDVVSKHLELCGECRSKVAEMSPDSFLGRLRDVQGQGQRDQSVTGWAHSPVSQTGGGSAVGISPPAADTMPPGLADHPDYEVIKELGRGGMGVVYLAHNRLMGRDEVLKVMGRHIIERPGLLDRFRAEIRAVGRLQHPNIVTAYSAFRLGESIVFAMEYVDGTDLAAKVKTYGPLPVIHACYFVHQAALGLQHAHEQGMVHRDIKPGNLMLTQKSKRAVVKVLDFGLAKATREAPVDGGLTNPGQALGTPDFMAPEQIRNAQKADIRADVYSLGCTLYYLLSGGPPFRADNLYDLYQAHHSMDAKLLNFVRPEVPSELAALVAKMLAKEPERRFQTPAEVAQALVPFFKKVNLATQVSSTEVSQVGMPTVQTRPVEVPTVPTQPATGLAPAVAPTVERSPQPRRGEPKWESLIEFKETEHSIVSLKPRPLPALGSARRLPRAPWGIIAAAFAFSLFALGVIIYITTDKGRVKDDIGDGKSEDKVEVEGSEIDHEPKRGGQASARQDEIPAVEPEYAVADSTQFTTTVTGKWHAAGDELVQTEALRTYSELFFGDNQWTDYDFTVDAMRGGGGNSFSFFFRSTDPDNGYVYAVSGDGTEPSAVEFRGSGSSSRLHRYNFSVQDGRWYTAHVHVRGKHFVCSAYDKETGEDVELFDFHDERHPKGRVGLQTFGSSVRFKNIKVTAPDGRVLWEGLPAVKSTKLTETAKQSDPLKLPVATEPGFVQLFNGIDLTGWKVHPEQPGNWRAENGILVGSGPAVTHLYTVRDEYKDFHLRAEVRINDGGNSGIYLRAPFGPRRPSNHPVWPNGYEAQIDSTHLIKDRTGSLRAGADHLPVVLIPDTPIAPGQWFSLYLVAEANRIVIMVNDKVTADYVDETRLYTKGHIVLQAAGSERPGDPETIVEFRKIEIKELAPSQPMADPKTRQTVDAAESATRAPADKGSNNRKNGAARNDAKKKVPDVFQPGTIWKGKQIRVTEGAAKPGDSPATLTVRERVGDTFKARFAIGTWIGEIHGTIENGRLRWLARDVRVVKGRPARDYVGTINGGQITLTSSGTAPSTGKRTLVTIKMHLTK